MSNKFNYGKIENSLVLVDDKKVIIRVDFNVPIKEGKILDTFRIDESLETIKLILENKGRVIILSHLENKEDNSLLPVFEYLKKFFKDIKFARNFSDLEMLREEKIVLVENIRLWQGEKENDKSFAERFCSFGDIFVNEAFSCSHREHASIVLMPKIIPSFAGVNFNREVEELSKIFEPERPFLFILGGAKLATKLPLVDKFLNIADSIFLGGALAHDLFRARGIEIGTSLVSEEINPEIEKLKDNKKIFLPTDVVVQNKDEEKEEKILDKINKEDKILDAGEETLKNLENLIKKSNMVVWNGPIGDYEKKGFEIGSEKLADILVNSGKKVIIGGGDTLAVINKLRLKDKFTFVSTAGGAMIDFLAHETLPGIKALE